MDEVRFEFAELHELNAVMQFISSHWSEKHIYAKSEVLLQKEFLWLEKTNKLTIALAKNIDGDILGIFCFKFFNHGKLPDLAGSLWKVTEDAERQYQMIGYRLRQFVIKNIAHRFFSAPGPGPQTKVIYQMLRLQWNQMKQYYLINPLISDYKLVNSNHQPRHTSALSNSTTVTLKKVHNKAELSKFDFDRYSDIVPFKDQKYIENRFFDYPFYNYDVFLVHTKDNEMAHNIAVCRKGMAKDANGEDIASAYRIVDFYGAENLLPQIILSLFELVKQQGDEFLDFICHGFDGLMLEQAGMRSLDFESSDVVIPNWFEPFVKKNVSVNCIADATNLQYRQCKADGDQDRPSVL